MPAPQQFDVLILGAGAAGLFCASRAAQRGRRVALLDHNPTPGRKILISGGGRCNFTNIHCTPANFLSNNPHFAKSALALFEPRHFIELVDRHQIAWHEKTLGQLFCDQSARQILDMLLVECNAGPGSVEFLFDTRILSVESQANQGFRLESSRGPLAASALVVATGGLSIPKLGASGFGYDLARQFGHAVVPPRPALVPLLLGGPEATWTSLAGVSTEVIAQIPSSQTSKKTPPVRFRENMLVTHRGLSGPAILQASTYWQPGQPIVLDLLPSQNNSAEPLLSPLLASTARRDSKALLQVLSRVFPQRFASHLATVAAPQGWSNAALAECEAHLHRFSLHPTGTEGFDKAEVTAGGVSTDSLNARTMESRAIPGLFFIGEVVDVTGHLGGFNFQWAWASAAAAARTL